MDMEGQSPVDEILFAKEELIKKVKEAFVVLSAGAVSPPMALSCLCFCACI